MLYLICLILNLFIEKSENNRAKNQNEKTPPKNIIPYKENKKVFLKRLLTKPRPKILLM